MTEDDAVDLLNEMRGGRNADLEYLHNEADKILLQLLYAAGCGKAAGAYIEAANRVGFVCA
jgi:hypothetical protein